MYSKHLIPVLIISASLNSNVNAENQEKEFSVSAVLSGAAQCQFLQESADPDSQDKCSGALPFQPSVSYKPTESDEFYFKFGFAAGTGLNGSSAFIVSPWAAVTEDDVVNINGRNRDYLLTAWYQHNLAVSQTSSLGLAFGIIDSTDYLDENAYTNDEYTQFMNSTLTNVLSFRG